MPVRVAMRCAIVSRSPKPFSITEQPLRASASAMAKPMPSSDPVINALFPLSISFPASIALLCARSSAVTHPGAHHLPGHERTGGAGEKQDHLGNLLGLAVLPQHVERHLFFPSAN